MARAFDRYDTFDAALGNPEAKVVMEDLAPDLLRSSLAAQLGVFPLGPFLEFALSPDATTPALILERLALIENPAAWVDTSVAIVPAADYEPDSVEIGSAAVHVASDAETFRPTEITLHGPDQGNPFTDVDVVATFVLDETHLTVGAFYNGGGRYVIRFLPPLAGTWSWSTTSNARSLDGLSGVLTVANGDARGPVRVADKFGFAHQSGETFTPFGTTAYAWTHQPEEVQERTLASLRSAPFNKLRMCLFPKSFLYNTNEPDTFVFPRRDDGSWDTERFDLAYFRQLDTRIQQLQEMGVEAELILFHPYDVWGFSHLGGAVDERYLRYVVRRLAAYPNVWWSMANEFELLTTKRPEDWHRLAGVVTAEDHVGHLLSIHNWSEIFDYAAPWATHASMQRGDRDLAPRIDEWRARWGKPVVIDEFGYEGDLDQGWGNLTPQEVVERFWAASVRGGYLTHGETYYRSNEEIFWAKGGTLIGSSPDRIAFLRNIIADSPNGRLDPLSSDWDLPWGGVAGEYIVVYFGAKQPLFRNLDVPAGMTAKIDIIDTWNMTIEELPGVHQGSVRVPLPARPYIAVRMRNADH